MPACANRFWFAPAMAGRLNKMIRINCATRLLLMIFALRSIGFSKIRAATRTELLSPFAMDKNKVAEILVEIGVLLELKGENPFKTRAYGAAARSLEGLSEPLAKLVAENRLGEVKAIGDALQKKI